jgi:NTP-dependent ternary system trypsin peptidase co-occuring protein
MDNATDLPEGTQIVPVKLENGMQLHIEVRALGREEVGIIDGAFKDLTNSIEAISVALGESLSRIKPQKAAVEFGVEVGVESGKLTALICKGSGKANLKITLEFASTAQPPPPANKS